MKERTKIMDMPYNERVEAYQHIAIIILLSIISIGFIGLSLFNTIHFFTGDDCYCTSFADNNPLTSVECGNSAEDKYIPTSVCMFQLFGSLITGILVLYLTIKKIRNK